MWVEITVETCLKVQVPQPTPRNFNPVGLTQESLFLISLLGDSKARFLRISALEVTGWGFSGERDR